LESQTTDQVPLSRGRNQSHPTHKMEMNQHQYPLRLRTVTSHHLFIPGPPWHEKSPTIASKGHFNFPDWRRRQSVSQEREGTSVNLGSNTIPAVFDIVASSVTTCQNPYRLDRDIIPAILLQSFPYLC